MDAGDADARARPGRRVFVAAVGIIAALVVVALTLAWRGYDQRRDDAAMALGVRASHAADVVERFVATRLSLLDAAAGMPVVAAGDIEGMTDYLVRLSTDELGLGSGVGYVDRAGQLRTGADTDVPFPVDLSDREYVRQVLATNRPYVSDAIVGRLSGELVVVLAAPVRDADGSVAAVLVATVPLDGIQALTEEIATEATLRIVDAQGNLIFDDDGAPTTLAPPADPSALTDVFESVGPTEGLRGEDDRVVAVRQVPSAGWRLALESERSVLEGPAQDAFVGELLLVGAAAAVALIAAGLVARRIGRLHRSALRQTNELASLERLTAALTTARSADDVAVAVHDLGPPVIGAEQMVLAASGDATPSGNGAAPDDVHLDVVPPPQRQRHRSLVATIGDQTEQALARIRRTDEINHLGELSTALGRATTTDEVIGALHEHAAVIEGVSTVTTALVDRERGVLELYGNPVKPSADFRSTVGLDDVDPRAAAIRKGDVVAAADPAELYAEFPAWAPDAVAAGVNAVAAAPFVLPPGPPLGALALTFDRPRRLDERARAVVATVTRLGVDALSRARLFDHEQHVADTLQASLKPARLPVVDGWRFTGVHRAGEAGSSVGGDWYDVAVLPNGTILLSVGDVTGRGPVAAGVMGLVRAAVHALALGDRDPASILDHTDRLLTSSTANQLATAWVGLLEPGGGCLHYASAGHLPPLALGPSGKRYLDEPPGLLLGTGLSGSRRTFEFDVEVDGSIVAFTDGLCERRDESLDTALRKLSAALGDGVGIDAGTVLRRAMGRTAADDVVVLVASRLRAGAT